MHDVQQSTIRILNLDGATVGTGFVVTDHVAVTCAHVVQEAGSDCDLPIHIQFFADEGIQVVHVLSRGWSAPEINDIAFLQLDMLPLGVMPVVLSSASTSDGHL